MSTLGRSCIAAASEWGALATRIPDWRWMQGMQDCWGRCAVSDAAGGVQWVNPYNPADQCEPDHWPDPDDPATAGCLLALLGANTQVQVKYWPRRKSWEVCVNAPDSGAPRWGDGSTLGRAAIAAAAAIGRWPGGAE